VGNRPGELGFREAGEDPAGGRLVDGEKATPPAPLPLEGVADAGEVTATWSMEMSGADDARFRLVADDGEDGLTSTMLLLD